MRAFITWMYSFADWLQAEQATAAKFGRTESAEISANIRLFKDAALLLREAYEVDLPNP